MRGRSCVVIAAIAALIFLLPGAPARAGAPFGGKPKAVSVDSIEADVVRRINVERAAIKLPPLAVSPELTGLARGYSKAMAERDFFAHEDPEGNRIRTRVEKIAGILNWTELGENIARNKGFSNPAEIAVREWIKSNAHRENIYNPKFRETGVGVWQASDGTILFTQIFLTRSAR